MPPPTSFLTAPRRASTGRRARQPGARSRQDKARGARSRQATVQYCTAPLAPQSRGARSRQAKVQEARSRQAATCGARSRPARALVQIQTIAAIYHVKVAQTRTVSGVQDALQMLPVPVAPCKVMPAPRVSNCVVPRTLAHEAKRDDVPEHIHGKCIERRHCLRGAKPPKPVAPCEVMPAPRVSKRVVPPEFAHHAKRDDVSEHLHRKCIKRRHCLRGAKPPKGAKPPTKERKARRGPPRCWGLVCLSRRGRGDDGDDGPGPRPRPGARGAGPPARGRRPDRARGPGPGAQGPRPGPVPRPRARPPQLPSIACSKLQAARMLRGAAPGIHNATDNSVCT